ncbi:ParA family protein [Enterococcus wangshanyuanii]|uniref:Chromosome partitioning protein ParA n=1 Tax=Enterococcus wangshanyuanii TaxID=2005703 RepID=A0ABQ1PTL3_9ENTE|nr:ParA family protein [Enterococcus wangshanyuanii]GGD03113.1 chromosome partitioning protein ParA [Enterococcus wangshanyuanii]
MDKNGAATILSVANQKGGVGKTTTTVNLGATLAYVYSKKVLLVDIDPQGNLTDNLNIDVNDKNTIYEVLKGETTAKETIQNYAENIDVLGSDIALAAAEREFTQVGSEHRLKKALEPVISEYDYIILDAPPSLGMLTVNAFTASNEIIIPIKPSIFSLKGFIKLNETIETVQEFTNEELTIRGILITGYNDRINIYKEMKESAEQIAAYIKAPIFDSYIRSTVIVDESQAAGQDLISFSKSSTAEEDYISFTEEYLRMVGE